MTLYTARGQAVSSFAAKCLSGGIASSYSLIVLSYNWREKSSKLVSPLTDGEGGGAAYSRCYLEVEAVIPVGCSSHPPLSRGQKVLPIPASVPHVYSFLPASTPPSNQFMRFGDGQYSSSWLGPPLSSRLSVLAPLVQWCTTGTRDFPMP